MNEYDDLTEFLQWWLTNRPINAPQDNALVYQKDTHGVVLYRQNPYQVELFTVAPNSEIVPHLHPNVDSYEIFVSGDINFMCDGMWFGENLLSNQIRVKPDSWHGGLFGERGGCFLSVQKWLNGVEPSFVGNDWRDKDNRTAYKDS